MKHITISILALALLAFSAPNAKALITLNVTGTCLAESNRCVDGVDTFSGTITYDMTGGTVPFFNVTTSVDNIVYDAATGGPVTFDGTSSSPPLGFSPETFMMTFAGAGLPDSAPAGTVFTIDQVTEVYGGPDIGVRNFYTGTATVVPVPAALPLFLSGLAALGFIARRRRPARRAGVAEPAPSLSLA